MVKKKRDTKIELPNADTFVVFFCLLGSFIVTLITWEMWVLPLGVGCMNLIFLMNIVARQNELIEKCRIIRSKEKS